MQPELNIGNHLMMSSQLYPGQHGATLSRAVGWQTAHIPQASLFRSNRYVQRLNEILQNEHGAVACFARSSSLEIQSAAAIMEAHQRHIREMNRLVIKNGGIPADVTDWRAPFVKALIGIASNLPTRWTEATRLDRVCVTTLSNIEKTLMESYAELLDDAPRDDLTALSRLAETCRRHLDTLTSHF